MPTDVNNLKDGQQVLAKITVNDENPNHGRRVRFSDGYGEAFIISRDDIITDWPPEPSADEDGWETESTFRCVDPDLHSFFVEPNMGFQYRIQRRPIAPKWVPTVGEPALWFDEIVTVDFIGKARALVTHANGSEGSARLKSLTQPKEQPHED